MTDLTFKGKPAVWDSDVKLFRMFYRVDVYLPPRGTLRPAHCRYYEFVGVLEEDAGDIIDVQVYGWRTPPFQPVLRRKPMPRYQTKWRFE